MALLSDLTYPTCPNLLYLATKSNGVSAKCMLDSSAMHSFVHPHIVQLTEAQPSKGAALTVIVANGSKVLCKDVCILELTFTVEGEDHQVMVSSQLFVLDGLQSDVILGIVF